MKSYSHLAWRRLCLWLAISMAASAGVWAQTGPKTGDQARPQAAGGFAHALLLDAGELPSSSLPARAVAETGITGRFNPEVMNAGRLRVELPDGRSWLVRRTREASAPGAQRTWVGEFEGQPGSLLVMTQYRGLVSGFMHHGAETWEIESTGPGRSRIYRVDESRLPPEGPIARGQGDLSGATLAAGTTSAATAAEPATHDVLVVYTAAAASSNGGADALKSKTVAAIEAANTAYTNSGVGVRLNLVGWQQVNYTETNDMGVSLSDLRSSTDGKMDEVHTLRNQVGADLVSLLTTDTNYCGIAYLGSAGGNAAYGFSVVSPSCFAGHTFAHELGHNQGNHHDRIDGSGTPAYPYSYGYRTCDYPALANGQSFRTVMAYSCASTPRVNYFSNPLLNYNNAAPMGISYESDPANSADNVRSMNNTATVIAAYRSGPAGAPPAAPGNLNAAAPSFDRVDLTWTDNAGDESGFTLQRAVGSGSFTDRVTLGANTQSFTDTGLTGSTSYSYRVRAYNSAGTSAFSNTATLTTPAAPPPPASPQPASLTASGLVVTLVWTNVTGETGYEVQRETLNTRKGTWSPSTSTVGADVSTMAVSLSAGTYRFKVRAYNGSGSSGYVIVSCTNSTSLSNCNNVDGSFKLSNTNGPKGVTK